MLNSIFEQKDKNKEHKINSIRSNAQGILVKTCEWEL